MIQAGDLIRQRVSQFRGKARTFFYTVMLFQRECVSCGKTELLMQQDNCCRCRACGAEFDPTVTYQTCPDCNHALILKIQHYWCPQCRNPVRSLFCFDERVFDGAYFREMMRESRDRRKEQVEKLRQLLLDSRSLPYWPDIEPILNEQPGFADDLAPFIAPMEQDKYVAHKTRPDFDMDVYRRHLLNRVPGCVVDFEGISALVSDARIDRIYRFITAIFLENERLLVLEQSHDGRITLVGA